jgi:hypothetical protein
VNTHCKLLSGSALKIDSEADVQPWGGSRQQYLSERACLGLAPLRASRLSCDSTCSGRLSLDHHLIAALIDPPQGISLTNPGLPLPLFDDETVLGRVVLTEPSHTLWPLERSSGTRLLSPPPVRSAVPDRPDQQK